jgi:diguanylate cyclase (GGDEF)-like protein
LLGTSESAASVSKADDGYRTAAADFEYSLNGLANITGKDAWTQELIGILRRESASKAQLYQDIFELTQRAEDQNSTQNSTQVRERLSKDGGRLSTSVSALVQTLSLNFSREAKRIQAENIQQAKALHVRLASLMAAALVLMTLLGWLLHRSRTIIRREMDALQHQALTDPLTAMPNLRAFKDALEKAMTRSRRRTDALTLAMIDLDHFKAFNDQHGHPAGDRLLTLAASNWSALIPEHASLSRIGGEEFALILPNTNSFEAETLLKKLLIATPENQSFSAGVSLYSHGENAESFIARADRALYRAKSEGRNRIAGEGSPTRISLAYVNA